MMYNESLKCGNCGNVFYEDEAEVRCVRRETMWEPAEYQGYCPHCGAMDDDAEVCKVCDNCGEGIVDSDLYETELGDYCEDCTQACYPELYAEYAA